MPIAPVSIPSTYNVFLYFLKGKVHEDSKLAIITDVGKSRVVKSIFSKIYLIHDACASSFGRYLDCIMYEKCFFIEF